MADYSFVTSTGVIVVDTSTTLDDVQQEYRDAFQDQDFVVDSGPTSVLINAEVEARDNIAKNNADIANQINPNEATGTFLDALLSLFDGKRDPGGKTTVIATLGGVAGTIIPLGSAAQDINNNRFTSLEEATIGGGGVVDTTFKADDIGEISVGIGELSQILSSITDWDSITNDAVGVTGSDVQSDEQARNKRNDLLARQSNSTPTAIKARLSNVSGVLSVLFRENVTNSTILIDSISLVSHSVYVCVDNGDDTEVATALLESKSDGADWNGSEEIVVIEPVSGQSYVVKFDRPTIISINVEVTANPSSSLSDPVDLIKQAILDYQEGLISGFDGFILSADVQPFDIATAVNIENSSLGVTRIEVKLLAAGSFTTDDIIIAINEKANTIKSDITVILV